MDATESNLKVEYGMNTTYITLNDERILEQTHINQLRDEIMSYIEDTEERDVVIDFSNVEFMSSSFLGLLVTIHKRMCEMKGHLQLVNIDSNIYKVFKITNLTKILDVSKA